MTRGPGLASDCELEVGPGSQRGDRRVHPRRYGPLPAGLRAASDARRGSRWPAGHVAGLERRRPLFAACGQL